MKKLLSLLFVFCFSVLLVKAYECTQVRAEHILVHTKAEAVAIEQQISNGASFEELAKKYSLCPSAKRGGDLGYFNRGDMVKPFEDASFSMAIGEVSEPVQTQFGWHIIKVLDKR